ncbi:MAG TPA: OsmC family protein [Niabella sp.]|nr:OsmC family protein [Niabella sp.]HOZ98034.1 OsmC family protein [Niabella sp.]HQW14821.1 OsmC family protein [Niabella sp.]HQX18554.1 OsmC family protein [Niabella sp.]HQX40774.1 OsmC family protein [Niabella sp.]
MNKQHQYQIQVHWQSESGTTGYNNYSRDHELRINNKATLACSSDPSFLGNPSKYNPEELFLASISSCHMLWYLHLCATKSIVVLSYEDQATGSMSETADGSGQFTEVTLFPKVTVLRKDMIEQALELHQAAHQYCFIANSLNFAVHHQPTIISKES